MKSDAVPVFPFNRIQNGSGEVRRPTARLRGRKKEETRSPAVVRQKASVVVEPLGQQDIEADARRLLRTSKSGLSLDAQSSDWLGQAGLNVRRSSDAQHIQALAFAYAASIQIAASPHRAALIAELENISGRKRSRGTTDLHLIVERFVSYGGESPAERLAARKLVSRDVRAIQHLQKAKVLPSRVATLAAARGEGLHAWARQTAVVKRAIRTDENPTDQARREKAEAGQKTLIHEVTITTRRANGKRVRRRRFTLTGVLKSEMTNCLESLRRLGSRC